MPATPPTHTATPRSAPAPQAHRTAATKSTAGAAREHAMAAHHFGITAAQPHRAPTAQARIGSDAAKQHALAKARGPQHVSGHVTHAAARPGRAHAKVNAGPTMRGPKGGTYHLVNGHKDYTKK